jgi:hypothetical protein
MNDVLNQDTLSSTHYFPSSGAKRIGVISALCSVFIERRGADWALAGLVVRLEEVSIAFAPRLSNGRNSLRYTVSVVRVFAWPTRCVMSSIGIIPDFEVMHPDRRRMDALRT